MTVKEYIVSLLPGVSIPEAFLIDTGLDLETDYDTSMYSEIGNSLISVLGGIILAPRVKTVNENGFSMSWDMDALGRYYLWLCKRYGITPDKEVAALIGTSSIIDISDTW